MCWNKKAKALKNAKCRKKCCRKNSLGTNQHNKTHLQKTARQCQIAINCVKICKNLPLEECGRSARLPFRKPCKNNSWKSVVQKQTLLREAIKLLHEQHWKAFHDIMKRLVLLPKRKLFHTKHSISGQQKTDGVTVGFLFLWGYFNSAKYLIVFTIWVV